MERLGPWPARLTWLVLPLVAGPSFGDALGGSDRSIQVVAGLGLWGIWAAVLVATLVPATVTLTALRITTPAAVAAAVASTVTGGAEAADAAALAGALAAAFASFLPKTGEVFVDGSSYGDERRMPLRVPGPLAAGPVPLVWAAVVAGIVAGPLLLAARQWVAGAVALAVGGLAVWWGVRVLHTLSRRWVVFVPAGVVVHDPLALVDPVLVPRAALAALRAAPADTDALDLTRGAFGLALELRFAEPVSLLVVSGRGASETVPTGAVLITPTRPGALLAEARSRRLA